MDSIVQVAAQSKPRGFEAGSRETPYNRREGLGYGNRQSNTFNRSAVCETKEGDDTFSGTTAIHLSLDWSHVNSRTINEKRVGLRRRRKRRRRVGRGWWKRWSRGSSAWTKNLLWPDFTAARPGAAHIGEWKAFLQGSNSWAIGQPLDNMVQAQLPSNAGRGLTTRRLLALANDPKGDRY